MSLFKRCKHRWIEVNRDAHRSRVVTGFEGRGFAAEEIAKDLIYGWTVIQLRCYWCNDVATRKLRGYHPK